MWKERKPNTVVYYAHPGMIFYTDQDPFSKYNRVSNTFSLDCMFKDEKHFYFIWDPLSESGFGQKLESLQNCDKLKMIRAFDKEDYFKLYFFEYIPPAVAH